MYTVPAYLLALSITLGSISGVSATPLEFTWDCTNSLATCNNYCYAAVCRALFSGTSKFTYDSDKSNAKKRRDQSGCSKNPCNGQSGVSPFNVFGSSCDEFPFASTTQGGAGAILRCVDPTENSSEGGQLGNFVKSQGLRSGDQYTIFIENYGGARYCATRPSCTNDGGEFRLSGNSFINARRGGSVIARNSSDFEPPDPNAEGPVPLRTFVADDGSTHMMLTDSKEDVIAQGTELFRGAAGSVVKIVEEL